MENPEAQARKWFMQVQEGRLSDEQQEALADWLCASPHNMEAYQQCEAVWEQLGHLDIAEMHPEPRSQTDNSFRKRFLAGLGGGFFSGKESNSVVVKGFSSWKAYGVALAGFAAVILGILLWNSEMTGSEVLNLKTGIAEVATYQLEDGSELTLGARSQVRVVISDSIRRVDIRSGRGFFDVASDRERPFYVYAHDARVEVVGTQFDVQRTEQRVTVSVLEGIVKILEASSDQVKRERPSVTLRAGDQVSKERHEPFAAIAVVPQEDVSAWRSGRLVYHHANLDDVVEELNRYSSDRFTLASPGLGDIELTASFQIDQLDALPELLAKTLPVRIQK